jgi:hypothetical protein
MVPAARILHCSNQFCLGGLMPMKLDVIMVGISILSGTYALESLNRTVIDAADGDKIGISVPVRAGCVDQGASREPEPDQVVGTEFGLVPIGGDATEGAPDASPSVCR